MPRISATGIRTARTGVQLRWRRRIWVGHGSEQPSARHKLEPDAPALAALARPAVGEPGDEVQAPARLGLGLRRVPVTREAPARVEHLDSQALGVVVHAQLDHALLLHV